MKSEYFFCAAILLSGATLTAINIGHPAFVGMFAGLSLWALTAGAQIQRLERALGEEGSPTWLFLFASAAVVSTAAAALFN